MQRFPPFYLLCTENPSAGINSTPHSALLGISIYYHIERTIHSMYNPNIIHRLCQYICVFYAKNFFCMNRQYLFRGFWSREAFFDKTTEMFADLRSGCGRAASLAPTADARRPSLAYGGHIVPFAPMAFPTKAKCETAAFRSTGEAQKSPALGKLPGLGLSCL